MPNKRGVGKIRNFQPIFNLSLKLAYGRINLSFLIIIIIIISRCISEMVQDMTKVTIND